MYIDSIRCFHLGDGEHPNSVSMSLNEARAPVDHSYKHRRKRELRSDQELRALQSTFFHSHTCQLYHFDFFGHAVRDCAVESASLHSAVPVRPTLGLQCYQPFESETTYFKSSTRCPRLICAAMCEKLMACCSVEFRCSGIFRTIAWPCYPARSA